MNKKLATLAASAVLVGLAGNTVAHAEEVPQTAPDKATTASATNQPVTKDQVDKAAQERDADKAELTDAEQAVETAKTADDTAKQKVVDAEATVKEDEAVTPEVVEKAKAEATDKASKEQEAAKTVSEKEAIVKTAETEQQDADTAVAARTKDDNRAGELLEQAQAAKAEVDRDLNPAPIEAAKQAVGVAEQNVTDKTAAVETAKTELEQAKAEDAKVAEQTQTAKTDLDAKSAVKQEKDAKTAELKAISDQKAQALKEAQAGTYAGISPDVKLDTRFVNAFKEYMDGYENTHDMDFDARVAKMKELRDKVIEVEKTIDHDFAEPIFMDDTYEKPLTLKTYEIDALKQNYEVVKAQVNDANIKRYNTKDLPEDVVEEMNLFAADVLNSIRAQFGLNPIKANRNTMKLAADIANKYEEDNQTQFDGHYTKGISEVANRYGLPGGPDENFYENLVTGSVTYSELSKAELFATIANYYALFFYEGTQTGHYGHAGALYKQTNAQGIAFSFVPTGDVHNRVRMHAISVSKGLDHEHPEKWTNTSDATIESPKNRIEELKQAANTALTNYSNANGESLTANTHYETAKRVYDALVATPKQTPGATTALTNAQAALTEATANLTEKQTVLTTVTKVRDNAQARLQAVTDALTNATENKAVTAKALVDANQKAQEAKTAYDKALAELNGVKATHQMASEKMADANRQLQDLEMRASRLEVSRKALADARAHALEAADALKQATAKVEEAKSKVTSTYNTWKALADRYALEQAILNVKPVQPTEHNKPVQPTTNNEQPVQPTDNTKPVQPTDNEKPVVPTDKIPTANQVNGNSNAGVESGNMNSKAQHQAVLPSAPSMAEQVATANVLPTTGEHDMTAIFSLAALSLIASVGLYGGKKEME